MRRAVSGNLTALAYVLSRRFASSFLKVAAHMRAYYLLVDPAEGPEDTPAAKSGGEASYSSDDASSSDSSDADGEGQSMRLGAAAASHEPAAQPKRLRGRVPRLDSKRSGPAQPVGQPSKADDGSAALENPTAGHEPSSGTLPTRRGAEGNIDPGASVPDQTGAASSGVMADPGSTGGPSREPPDKPSSSSMGGEQQLSGGKGEDEKNRAEARQRRFWLTFKHGGLEQAFIGWQATQQAKVGLTL
jgi:hypothetical protein